MTAILICSDNRLLACLLSEHLTATLVGVPAYLNGYVALPLVNRPIFALYIVFALIG